MTFTLPARRGTPRSCAPLAAVVVAALAWTGGCSDSVEPLTATTMVPATIAVSFTALQATQQLSVVVRDQHGAPMTDPALTWQTLDAAVATVSATGVLTAAGNGTTSVRVTSGAAEAVIGVTVAQAVATVNTSQTAVQFTSLQETVALTATGHDANGHSVGNATPVWSTADPAIAQVSGTGLVTSVANGSTTLTATSGAASRTVSVTVAQVAVALSVTGAAERTLSTTDTLTLVADARDARGHALATPAITWSSSDAAVATVSTAGRVTGGQAGTAMIRASTGATLRDSVQVNVLNTIVEAIPASLATPAPGALWEIPVVIIRYIPTLDGVRIDSSEVGFRGTPAQARQRIAVFEERIKFMLEEGSRFRGYKNAAAPPSLGYRVVHILTVFAHFQRGREVPWNPGHYFPDYHQILGLVNAESWVKQHGVKEFWVWGYHSNLFEQPESNMSSPTGDISNSSRFSDDLPVFDRTYTVYGYNMARSQAEAVHNHGHQLESILARVDTAIFRGEFVGMNLTTMTHRTGRAGWTHMPPNTTTDYDYLNSTSVASDIADWRPGGGQTRMVADSTWGNVPYAWPASRLPGESVISQRVESQWYIYWMQSMPGRDNAIPHGTGTMTNWWEFTADWDGALKAKRGLSTFTATAASITVRNDHVGGITLSPGGALAPGATATFNSAVPLTVSVWDCGGQPGCVWDPYTLQPGRAYRVISNPSGPAADLVVVLIP